MVTDGEEKAWLFHELGRCYLELGGNEEARKFGVRSLTAADEISDEKWKIMAIVLISQAECKYNFDNDYCFSVSNFRFGWFHNVNLFKFVHVYSNLIFQSQRSFVFLAKLGNFESSVSCFERALNLAKLQDDDDPFMLDDIQKVPDLTAFASVSFSKDFY